MLCSSRGERGRSGRGLEEMARVLSRRGYARVAASRPGRGCVPSWHIVLPFLPPFTDGYTLRCHPAEDLTNGFFVACFQRREKQPLLATKRKQIDATTSPPPATDMGGAAPSAASVANAAPSESVRKKKRCKKKKKIPIPLVPSNTQVKN